MRTKSGQGEKGQVAILFALVFTFMFVLFAFVVDFGHLVHDKMNLQVAADAAAYAGAAWQARTLNRIATLNYRLRQDFKELAMRVNVTHLRHNRNFPRGPQFYQGAGAAPQVDPFICQQAHGYQAISGLKYSADTNLCRNADPSTGGLPPIVVPPVIAAFDPFAVAIASQIRSIQQAANRECRAAADDNRLLAEHLVNVYTQRANFHANQIREIQQWLNSVNGEDPQNSNHPEMQAAYQSALRNLSLSNKDDFKMEVLQPSGGEYVHLEENRARASLFYINFQVQGDGCVGRPGFLDFDGMPVSFTKTQSIVTYFAVKLTAKPKMLFMPSKWVEGDVFPVLEAFAAAKPFGSRIGPDATTDQLVPIPNRPGNNSRLINFSFRPGDNLGIYNTKIMAYLDALHPFNGIGRPDGNQNTGWPEPNRAENLRTALQAIRAPTIFDAILYTVFPDPGANIQQDYLEPQYATALYPDYMEAADPQQDSVLQTPESKTPPYFPNAVGSKNRGPGWIQINADGGGGGGPYGNYASEQIASHSVTTVAGLPLMDNPSDFGWATKEMVHSGWAPEGEPGRIGYSVKFIGMDALVRTLRVRLNDAGTEGPIANPPTGDPNIKNVYH
jgi:hypothetical protein